MSQPKRKFEVQTSICVHLDQFDLNAPKGGIAKGIVLAPSWMQGQPVGVRLMDRDECLSTFRAGKDEKLNSKFFATRPSVANFASGFRVGSNSIPPMAPGGIIMFHGCTRDEAASSNALAVWKSQYMENYGNEPGRSVLHGVARVEQREYAGAVRANLDILSPGDAKMIGSLKDVTDFYSTYMEGYAREVGVPSLHANKQPIALMRLLSAEGAKSRLLYTQQVKKDVVDNDGNELTISVPGNAADSLAAAFVLGQQGKGFFTMVGAALDDNVLKTCPPDVQHQARELREKLVSGEVGIEMIPGMRIPIVGKSLDDLIKPGSKLGKAASQCLVNVTDSQGNTKEVLGFVKMTVGLMLGRSAIQGEAPNVIVTKFTKDDFAKARSADFIATPNYAPQFTQAREHEAIQRAEKAAGIGGVAVENFDNQAEEIHTIDNESSKRAELASDPSPGAW